HEGAAMEVGGIVPGLDPPFVPALGVKVLQGVILFAGEAEQPVAGRAGGDVGLVHPADGERAVGPLVHGAAGLLILVKNGAAVLVDHDAVVVQRLVAAAVKLLGEQAGSVAQGVGAVVDDQVVLVLFAAQKAQAV